MTKAICKINLKLTLFNLFTSDIKPIKKTQKRNNNNEKFWSINKYSYIKKPIKRIPPIELIFNLEENLLCFSSLKSTNRLFFLQK